jgi:hypothetical protein
MSKGAAELKAAFAAFLALGGLWHLFGPSLGKRLTNGGRDRRTRRRPTRAQNDPSRNVPIDPV